MKEHDIVAYTETWTNPEKKDVLELDGWDLYAKLNYRRAKKGRFPGGIVVYVKEKIKNFFIERNTHMSGVLFLQYEQHYSKKVFGFAYNPPPCSQYSNPSFYDELEEEVMRFKEEECEVYLLGDFNSRVGEGRNDLVDCVSENVPENFALDAAGDGQYSIHIPARNSKDKIINPNGLKLLDFLKTTSMYILNGRTEGDLNANYTFANENGASTIDLALAPVDCYYQIQRLEVLNTESLSSHFPISLQMEPPMLPPVPVAKEKEDQKAVRIKRFRWIAGKTRYYIERFCRVFHGFFLLCCLTLRANKVEDAAIKLTALFQTSATILIPEKKSKALDGKPAWWNAICTYAKNRYIAAQTRIQKRRNQHTVTEHTKAKRKYRKARRNAMQKYQETKRQGILKLRHEHDAKAFWNTVKQYTKPKTFVSSNISAQDWVNHFKAELNPGEPMTRPEWEINDEENEDKIDIIDEPFTSEEVYQAIVELKNGKAAGRDGILAEMIKGVQNTVVALLTFLFQKIYDTANYPAMWVEALIHTIYKKKGSPQDPKSYRGVALLSHLGKIFTKILNKRLVSWLETNNKLSDHQNGFRKGRSCIDGCFILDTLISDTIKQPKRKLYTCFFDYKSAFPSVPRAALWKKLYDKGVRGKSLRLLKNMHSKSTFLIKLNEFAATEPQPITVGTMQGCLLAPTLFCVFIDSLIEYLNDTEEADAPILGGKKVAGMLYADDLVTASRSVAGLQKLINRVEEFSDYWGLNINLNKTECVVFRRGGRLALREQWSYKGNPIKISNRFRYLGLLFSCCRTFNPHIEGGMGRGIQAVGALKRLMYGVRELPLSLLYHLFDMTVTPVVLYGAEVFGLSANVEKMDKVAFKFYRSILGLPNGTPGAALVLETNRVLTPSWQARLKVVNYWLKLLKIPEDKLLKLAYRRQRQMAAQGIDCWALRLKEFLENFGLGELWESERLPADFTTHIEKEVLAQAGAEMLAEIQTKPSLELYKQQCTWGGRNQEIMELNRTERRLMLAARLNLPMFVTYCTRRNEKVKLCKFCMQRTASNWEHSIYECKDRKVHEARLVTGIGGAVEATSEGDVEANRETIFFNTAKTETVIDFLKRLDKIAKKKEKEWTALVTPVTTLS